MTNLQTIFEVPGAFPGDLRQCLEGRTLVRLVFEALHAVEQEEAQVSGAKPLPPGLPRVWLSVLTFSYASGLYPSDEIELQMASDPELRYLSANAAPSAAELRRCRRQHRALLQRTLSRVLRLAWEGQQPWNWRDKMSSQDLVAFCDSAARVRLEQAVLADTMALHT